MTGTEGTSTAPELLDDDDAPQAIGTPPAVAKQGLLFTLTPQSGPGSCTADFKFNGTPMIGTPSADWCQIQQAVNAVRAAGTGGTIELVNTGQAFRLTGPVMLNADDLTIVGLPDAQGEKPVIDFDPPVCTYATMPHPNIPGAMHAYCQEHSEINYSAFTVNDQTAGCAHRLLNAYCPRERVTLENLAIHVRRGLAGPATLANQAAEPPIASQSVVMLMNCGDCKVQDTDVVAAYGPGPRGVSQDGITFGPGTTGQLGSTGASHVIIDDIAKAGLYLTPLSGIHRDAGGTLDDSGVTIDKVDVSRCGIPGGWGSGISISGHRGTVSNCTVAHNDANGIFAAPQPQHGPGNVPADWAPVQSTRITDCDIHHNKGPGVLIGSAASAYGVDFVPEDAILTRIDAHDNAPYDGVRVEGGRHVTIDGGTFVGNNVGINLANQTHAGASPLRRIDGMTSDITISGIIAHGNVNHELLLVAVEDVAVRDAQLYDSAVSTSPAHNKGITLWGSHGHPNRGIALDELNIGEKGMLVELGGQAPNGIYSLIGKAGPTNPSGNPNTYYNGGFIASGLYAPKGSTFVDTTHGVTYWKSTDGGDPTGWVVTGPQKIVAGYAHTCALLADGTVQCWGYNLTGQLGLGVGSPTMVHDPTPVADLGDVVDIAAGAYHTCALDNEGRVYCWGDNYFKQLGTGNQASTTSPTLTLLGAVAISATGTTSCALMSDHTVRCWGGNWRGQVGAGYAGSDVGWPEPVDGIAHASAIAVGSRHTCALLANGAVQCWGDDYHGELGDGPSATNLSLTPVTAMTGGAATLTAGLDFTCASTTSGELRCWGYGGNGAIGDGSFVDRDVPTAVTNATGALQVGDAQWMHACGILAGGDAYCWGDNQSGQLGDGTNTTRATTGNPVAHDVASISAGNNHTCAILTSGAVECWGSNMFGQLGQPSTTTESLSPVAVTLAP